MDISDAKESRTVSDYEEDAFQYQLDLLKIEIDLVDRSVSRDEIRAQNVKNFAVVVWAACVTVFLGQADLRRYVIFTAIMPILFWALDVWWTRHRMGVHVRSRKIAEFLNSPDFKESFRLQEFQNFSVFDVTGKQYRDSETFKRWSSWGRIMTFKEMILLYGGLTAVSLALGIFALVMF